MKMKASSSVAAGAAIIFAGTLVSRLLGLVRDNMLVNVFHDRMVTDAFKSAFLVPDTAYYMLAGGALSAAFIPIFAGYLSKRKSEDANRVASSIINLMLLAIGAALVLLMIFTPQVVRVIAPGYEPGSPKFNLTVVLAREMCVMVLFTGLSGLFTGMLQSYRHFLVPVIVWNTYNLSILLGIAVFSKIPINPQTLPGFLHWEGPTLGVHGAAFGVLLGAITLALFQLPTVIKHGFSYKPIIDLTHEGVVKVLALFAPVMVGLSLSQVNLLAVPQIMGSLLPDGAVTDLNAANRLIILPFGLFALAIVSSAFPKLSQQTSLGEMDGYKDTINRSLKMISLLILPSTVGLFVLTEPIISLLYGGKGYGVTDIQAAAFALALFCIGLFAMSHLQMISRAFYALHDTITPVIVSICVVAANVLLSLFLIRVPALSYGGVALSSGITITIGTLILFNLLRRRVGGFGGRSITIATMKMMLASVVMGAVMFGVAYFLAPHGNPLVLMRWPAPDLLHRITEGMQVSRIHVALQIAASGAAGCAAYYAMLKLLKVEEVNAITDRLMNKFRRKAAVV